MNHPWDPEHIIDQQTAMELIRAQIPSLSAQTIRPLGSGWDNTAFLVNEKYVFRFPRRSCALAFLEAEWALLPQLAPLLSLPIPIPQWYGTPSEKFPWP